MAGSPGITNKILDDLSAAQVPSTDLVGIVVVTPSSAFEGKPRYISGGSKELVDTFGKATIGYDGYVAAKKICDTTSCWVYNVPHTVSGTLAQSKVELEDNTDSSILVEIRAKKAGVDFNDNKLIVTAPGKGTFGYRLTTDTGDILEKRDSISLNKQSLAFVNNVKSDYLEFELKSGNQANTIKAKEYVFAGGVSITVASDNANYIKGINELTSDSYNINFLTVPCMSHVVEILSGINTACDPNETIEAIVAPPKAVVSAQDIVNWSNGDLTGANYPTNSINNSQISVYAPWGTVFDEDINGKVVISPECEVLETRVYTNKNYKPWFAPAGVRRGKIRRFLELEAVYDKGARDLLIGGNNVVNPIAKIGTSGFLIYGQKTSERTPGSQLSRIQVRALQNYIQRQVSESTEGYVFEQNDEITWRQWETMATNIMQPILVARGVYGYVVSMHPTPEEIDQYQMPGLIKFQPEKAAEFIEITFNLKPASAEL